MDKKLPRIDYERLLHNVSIEDIANRLGMTLKKTTANQFVSLCPFHDDKNPSLLIDCSREGGRQHFYCFSCGAKGDSIDLVKQKLNVGFKEAVDWLDPSRSAVRRGSINNSVKKILPLRLTFQLCSLDIIYIRKDRIKLRWTSG